VTGTIVAATGAIGAVLRWSVGTAIQRRAGTDLPIGTASINLAGALALGTVVGLGVSGDALAATAGLIAGFTTYSTWMVETVVLFEEGSEGRWRSVVNGVGLLATGIVAAWLGLLLGRAF
jgi:CrcB protein